MKNVAITKKGTENPNKALSTDPIIGPNNNPRLILYKKKKIYAVIVSMIPNFF